MCVDNTTLKITFFLAPSRTQNTFSSPPLLVSVEVGGGTPLLMLSFFSLSFYWLCVCIALSMLMVVDLRSHNFFLDFLCSFPLFIAVFQCYSTSPDIFNRTLHLPNPIPILQAPFFNPQHPSSSILFICFYFSLAIPPTTSAQSQS